MKIERCVLERHRGTTDPIASARARWNERTGLLLRLYDDDGRCGVGEASPLPSYSRETIEECEDELSHHRWPEIDESDPTSALDLALPAARFAAETALLDLMGRRRQQSISSLLGGATKSIPLSALVHAERETDAIAEIERIVSRGIRTLKLKIGKRTLEEDLRSVRAIRDRFADRIALRLDANQVWSFDEAMRAMVALEPYRPELLEEPSSAWDRFESPPPIPIALDEALQHSSFDRVRELAERKVIAALVLKPMALGGFSRCLELAELAVECDLACVVTHLFDGPIALAAAAELALSLPGRVLACGLDRHPGLAAWPKWKVPQLAEAEILPRASAGLGVEVDG